MIIVPENDDPYGAYGWRADSLEVYVPEDLPPGTPVSSRERVLTLYQYGGTLASADLLWELTPSLLKDIPLIDLFFFGTPGTGVSINTSRQDTGTNAYLFTGQTNSLFTVPNEYHPSPQDIQNGFTLSTFLSGSMSPGYILIRHSTDSSTVYYGISIRVSGSTSYIQYKYSLTSITNLITLEAELPADIFDGTWSHIAIVHQLTPSREARIYCRGVLLTSGIIQAGDIVADNSGILSVGAKGNGDDAISGIILQDVRIYYTALDSSQVNKQRYKQTNKQTNKQNKQTNKINK